MTVMKKIPVKIITCLIIYVCITHTACDKGFSDFLDKPPGIDITEDTIFSSQKNIETFLFSSYSLGIHSYYPFNNRNGSINPYPTTCMTAPMTDEAEMSDEFYSSQVWNSGGIQKSNNQEDARFNIRWQAIRKCNIIIERMPAAPVPQEIRDQFTGEALFIRALNNFEMFKRYGGMPIIDKRFRIDDDMAVPRSPVKDYVDYIVNDCNEAARLLANVTYTPNQRGRITRLAVLALKAKTLLYAASPLFNTATPYIGSENNDLVCYGNYDRKRWEDAATAAKEVIDAAPSFGIGILDNNDPENDYRKVWETTDNIEIILGEKFANNVGNWEYPWSLLSPQFLAGMNGWSGVCVPHNFVRKFEKMNGEPQVWNEPGVEGDDLMEKYAELDPRFRQTVAYNGSAWSPEFPEMMLYQGGSHNTARNKTGAMMHKLIPSTLSPARRATPNAILFRLGEAYLNYAEALNEANDTPPEAAFAAIDLLRDRAGMPPLPRNLNRDELRERIKNERAVELSFEDHRLWDIRRWMDAEKDGVMLGSFYKVIINKVSGSGLASKCNYEIAVFETRSFNRNMYLHPIVETEVNKGYMVQNPGW